MGGQVIGLKRAYDPAGAHDGRRFLVERLWPRGVSKTSLKVDSWLKEVAPSTALRHWFSHDPKRWNEFRRRYFKELTENEAACAPLLEAASKGDVTLVYSSHDTEHNNALALKEYLETRLGGRHLPHSAGRAA
jgi:uncharacterized protein YeaO (DUF488 family)